jgi:hypothetical protein
VPVYTTEETAKKLGITSRTLKKYVKNPEIPITGYLENTRKRIFSEIEIENFRIWLEQNPQITAPGRKPEKPRTRTIIDETTGKKRRIVLSD